MVSSVRAEKMPLTRRPVRVCRGLSQLACNTRGSDLANVHVQTESTRKQIPAARPVSARVSTPVGGISEMIFDGETGFPVQPGDVNAIAACVCDLLGNASKRNTMGRRAWKLAREESGVNATNGWL